MNRSARLFHSSGIAAKAFLACLLLSGCAGCSREEEDDFRAAEYGIRIEVDPAVELVSLVHRLAGDGQYTEGLLPGYSAEIENRFGRLKEHRAVRFARHCAAAYRIGGDAPMALAVTLGSPPDLKPRIDISRLPADFDPRWDPELTGNYLDSIRSFAAESDFMSFYDAHETIRRAAVENLEKMIHREHFLDWLRDFFGYPPQNIRILIGLQNGSCNYGYSLTLPDAKKMTVCLLGARWPDRRGAPTYPRKWFLSVLIHEFCHAYINPLILAHPGEFRESGEALLGMNREQMVAKGYTAWNVVLNEYLVRACTIRYLAQADGNGAARKMMKRDQSEGFPEIEGLAGLLEQYENHRTEHENFNAFLPRIQEYFKSVLRKP